MYESMILFGTLIPFKLHTRILPGPDNIAGTRLHKIPDYPIARLHLPITFTFTFLHLPDYIYPITFAQYFCARLPDYIYPTTTRLDSSVQAWAWARTGLGACRVQLCKRCTRKCYRKSLQNRNRVWKLGKRKTKLSCIRRLVRKTKTKNEATILKVNSYENENEKRRSPNS